MTKSLLILLLISCASIRKTEFPPEAEIVVKNFSSVKEAQNFIRNKSNYLFLLFEQSHDPYYGTPKWQPECLKTNQLSGVRENAGNLFFDSQLILNEKNEPGYCSGNIRDVIYLQCKDEARVYEVICPAGKCRKIPGENPCPVKN